MKLYGLRGLTHHGGRLMSVISPDGAQAVVAHIEAGDDPRVVSGPGRAPQYHEIRAGALDQLVRRYAIEVVDGRAWQALKDELAKPAR